MASTEATANRDPAVVLEVDADFEGDSAVGDVESQLSAFSQSLTSSVTAYPVEHGRRYHAYKDGDYFMPNDEDEQDRLDLFHNMLGLVLEGDLFLSPIKKERLEKGRVLDVGTGTGIWAVEMGDKYPDAEILGNDLSPVQPSWVPPNVKFEVDDAESPWTHARPFDLVFCRYLDGAISDWAALVRNAYSKTSPGGWTEFHAFDTHFRSDDGTLKPEAFMNQFVENLKKGCQVMGKELVPGPRLEGWFKDAGFQNIAVKTYKVPLGPWAKDERLKKIGMFNLLQAVEGIEAFTMRVFTKCLGWTPEDVQAFDAKVVADFKSKSTHSYFTFYVVYGQKPESSESS
ncbi:S-adenosyl-L-methionine-dependent methyltransferase [Phyllosticta citricarpa]|uniref:S-adenosyl-L-methionine-dependent methyltransferase n=1 Tax=Phyllosticta citricarpa TaxID=55181 RepID=A0ABR1MBW3_9PEZI